MSPRYDKEWIDKVVNSEQRLGSTSPKEFLLDNGLREGMTVIDYGCGPGFFALPAAEIVGPDVEVYALDIEPSMVALVGRKATERGLGNIRPVLNSGHAAPLPDAVADFAICALVLHYCDGHQERVRLARDLGRLLRSRGRALIIQHRPGEATTPDHDTSFEETERVLGEAGLESRGPFAVEGKYYQVLATRRRRKDGRTTQVSRDASRPGGGRSDASSRFPSRLTKYGVCSPDESGLPGV